MTPAALAARERPHPLEQSDRLALQATAAVGLLERFGDLVTVALEAVGAGDDAALRAALDERQRLVTELEPVLAALAAARQSIVERPDGTNARAALAAILRPVDQALRHAQLLHLRLTDEVSGTPIERPGLAIVR